MIQNQESSRYFSGKDFKRPEITEELVMKHLLSAKYKKLHPRLKNFKSKPIRVFDSLHNPYINLEEIDFTKAFQSLKKYFTKNSNWL